MLKNLHKQNHCFCLRDNKSPTIEYEEYEHGETGIAYTAAHEIIFAVQGTVHIRDNVTDRQRLLNKGDFVFMPMGVELSYNASAGSALLIMRLVGNMPECHVFRINKPLIQHDSAPVGELYALSSNMRMEQFIEHLVATIKDGFKCLDYLRLKVSEMYYLLHGYYSEEECHNLFSHITTPDMAFSEFVRMNFLKYHNAATLATALNMSKVRFINQFKKIYGTTPREWIYKQKSILVYHDLCQSHKTLKQISFEYGFSLPTNFSRYCRQVFGKTPKDIRDGLN